MVWMIDICNNCPHFIAAAYEDEGGGGDDSNAHGYEHEMTITICLQYICWWYDIIFHWFAYTEYVYYRG